MRGFTFVVRSGMNASKSMSKPETDLERLVIKIQEAGQEWIEAKLRSDQLEGNEKNILAAMINDLRRTLEKASEAKLECLARGSAEFQEYVTGRVMAQAETGRKKVNYEAALNYWEAKRSQLAFDRVKIEKGIYHNT